MALAPATVPPHWPHTLTAASPPRRARQAQRPTASSLSSHTAGGFVYLRLLSLPDGSGMPPPMLLGPRRASRAASADSAAPPSASCRRPQRAGSADSGAVRVLGFGPVLLHEPLPGKTFAAAQAISAAGWAARLQWWAAEAAGERFEDGAMEAAFADEWAETSVARARLTGVASLAVSRPRRAGQARVGGRVGGGWGRGMRERIDRAHGRLWPEALLPRGGVQALVWCVARTSSEGLAAAGSRGLAQHVRPLPPIPLPPCS